VFPKTFKSGLIFGALGGIVFSLLFSLIVSCSPSKAPVDQPVVAAPADTLPNGNPVPETPGQPVDPGKSGEDHGKKDK
jgi:hypothetical protein